MTSEVPTSWNELPVLPYQRFRIDLSTQTEELPRVCPVWDHQLGRLVACKYTMDPALVSDFSPDELDELVAQGYALQRLAHAARFTRRYSLLREARMMAMVDHPNVLSILEIGRFENLIVMLLPYLDGGTLADRDFSGPWEAVLDTALQLGRGIEALHDVGVLHRDLKPENILFDSAGRPRVADLELACRLDHISALTECVGTPTYMPPGVEEKGFEDVRDDLYVYCLMVFEMFYGRPAFDSQADRDRGNVAKVRRRHGMSRELHDIIVRGLAPDRNDRWSNMAVLLERMERVRRPSVKRRWVWGSAAAALAIGIGIGSLVDEQTAEADACSDMMEELGPIWNEGVQGELRGAFGTRKAGDGLTAWANRWLVVRAGECSVARRDDTSLEASPCSASLRDRFQATLYAFRASHLNVGLRFASVIADLPAPEHCIDRPDDAEWGYGGLLELRDLDVEVDALVRLGDLGPAQTRQGDYMSLAVDLGSEYGIARANYFQAEIHRNAGRFDDAAQQLDLALEASVHLGAHAFTAECLLKLTALAGDRDDLAGADAYGRMASTMFGEYQPDRVAEVLQVHGLALLRGDERERNAGMGMLMRAVEMREDQHAMYGGTRELLSQAHENYARGLIAVGGASEAIEYLDLALHVHQDEFGHGTWRTRGILRAKFTALLALGRYDDAAPVERRLLQVDADKRDWEHYFDDATWLAGRYGDVGEPHRAAVVLRAGRDKATALRSQDRAAFFDAAILELGE